LRTRRLSRLRGEGAAPLVTGFAERYRRPDRAVGELRYSLYVPVSNLRSPAPAAKEPPGSPPALLRLDL
jgi:hypothetical protein